MSMARKYAYAPTECPTFCVYNVHTVHERKYTFPTHLLVNYNGAGNKLATQQLLLTYTSSDDIQDHTAIISLPVYLFTETI
jgi:hypothetical protein